MLNSQQILEEGLLKLEHSKGKPAQIGYDVSLKQVNSIGIGLKGKIGKVLKDKTELTSYTPYPLQNIDGVVGWLLYPGVYEFTFNEGCDIPNNRAAFIKQRSSLIRNGAIINSPVFDPGFKTEFMGSFCFVFKTLFIEENARVAQIYFHECEPAELYNGSWQYDKQRKTQ